MAGRTFARSAASRDQASSPPKRFNNRQSQSPTTIAQRTRSGRSRSIDLGESDGNVQQKQSRQRASRQGSAESDNSVASSRGRRTRQATRKAAVPRDLSMVAEDPKEDRSDSADSDEEDNDSIVELPAGVGRSHSPGANSQMSGTTVFSAATSFAAPEMAKLDPMAAENLPELFQASRKILDLLAPHDGSPERVESTVRDLHIAGSRCATKLKFNEDKFNLFRQLYGSEVYIKVPFIVRSLLGTQNPLEGDFRPDAILYAANLATVVKEFLVIEKESEKARLLLMGLDSTFRFPEPFLESFDQEVRFGKSSLLGESFDLMLDIRTQFTIASLRYYRDEDDFVPDELLTDGFYDTPAERDIELDLFQDVVTNGHPRGLGPTLSKDHVDKIYERATSIRSTFRQNKDARQASELVDFDQLEEQFPWLEFLTRLVQWSRLRLNEILRSIDQQKGINNIMPLLIAAIKLSDSQAEIDYEPPPISTRQPQPTAEVTQETPVQSLYTKSTARFLEDLRQPSSSARFQSSLPQVNKPGAPEKKTVHSRGAGNRARDPPNESDFPNMDDVDINHDFNPPASSYVSLQTAYNKERNKENRLHGQDNDIRSAAQQRSRQMHEKELQRTGKPSMYDRHPAAERVTWSSEGSDAGFSAKKRPRAVYLQDEELSEDEGFEQDKREPDPSRRRAAHQERFPVDDSRPSKRARQQARVGSEMAAPGGTHPRAEARQNSSPRQVDEDEDTDIESPPPPTAREVSQAARLVGIKSRMGKPKTQTRRFWTDNDTQYFIDSVGKYGCSWTVLEKLPDWEIKRDQVALKDKGRNLKLSYLLSDTELPENFDRIRLSKKEIDKVKARYPDYEQ